ncbi:MULTISPECIES: GNAT family N-acetyltransferase [Arthrobacter]|uniref:N-acetyltransferase n=1 Tax=Arthrobacter terricola TaxID=2547396 RepID=A0A4V2ZS41_9MICC|nr:MULTISPECIES: GNAT family N-acetyltransferase [Arthrobacter]MBT8162985.1 GNAT family N-acetyltransferase [Arthrobacter sp. GN70]TDF91804.1 N-acetyltransferase [Arthrobacter terricola]
MTTLEDVWPLFQLCLTTPRLVLRPVRDEDIPAYIEAAASGIHDPERTPFAVPWTDAAPEILPGNLARWIWQQRNECAPADWNIIFGVWTHEGNFLGTQCIGAKDFGTLRTVETGSWLRRSVQRRGFGHEMRAAVLLWAFDWLGAECALTGAVDWNGGSLGVSRRLGYVPNGEKRVTTRPGVVERELLLRLSPHDFRRPDWTLTIEGANETAAFLGLQ